MDMTLCPEACLGSCRLVGGAELGRMDVSPELWGASADPKPGLSRQETRGWRRVLHPDAPHPEERGGPTGPAMP